MAINFCHGLYHTKLSTDKVSIDGHEASQILSPGNKGFIAESFIRSPVNFICTFACNIDIDKVVVCGKVGAQHSTGFELFTYHEKRDVTKLGQVQFQFNNSFICQPIGKLISSDKTIFTFTNPMFRARHPFVGLERMPFHHVSPDHAMETHLRCRSQRNLSSVSYLVVRILRTASGSVPCIGWLEVWGQPAASSHAYIIADVFAAYRSIVCPKPLKANKQQSSDLEQAQSNNTQNCINIPEDFIDPITQDIMTLPVLLPSGHSVDQTTLDRYEKEEAQWGRGASDPFTGVAFSRSSKPEQNTTLKVRIDHFLFKHGSEISVTNRTLGTSKIGDKRPATASTIIKPMYFQDLKPNIFHHHEQKTVRNVAAVNEAPRSKCSDPPLPKKIKTDSISSRSSAANDIDSLLDQALSGLPSFMSSKPCGSSSQECRSPPLTCSECKTVVNITHLYELGCNHYICRSCILNKTKSDSKISCSSCFHQTERADVVKVHQ